MSITIEQAKAIIEEFCDLYPLAVVIEYNLSQKQEELYGQEASKEKIGAILGAFHPSRGQASFATSNFRDETQFRYTLRHEILGHFGINTFTADEKRSLLNAIIGGRDQPGLSDLWENIDKQYDDIPELLKAEEVYAFACEVIKPLEQFDKINGEQAMRETCIEHTRPMQVRDLINITLMVADGMRDLSRSQQIFPLTDHDQFRRNMNMKKPSKPFHEVVAEKLIEQLKQGTAPWQKPWEPGHPSGFVPLNPTTGKRYRGINAIQLMSQEHEDQRWMTYKQAAAVGAQVRKDEKGTTIQYWKFSEEQTKLDSTGKPVLDGEGKPIKLQVTLERPRVFYANVFNAEQIDGLPPLERKEYSWNAIDRAESILQSSGAVLKHGQENRAFYRPSTDSIHLPGKDQFSSADNYYATALHELGHWTGHESRLDRDMQHPFGSEGYAKEELRAEIASMIMGDELGIGHDPEQHTAYVGTWIKVLEEDPLEIFRAAADAEKIQGYLFALEQKQVQEQAPHQYQKQEANMQTLQPGLNTYQAKVKRLLRLSTLTPGVYVPSELAKTAKHHAIFVDDEPVILCKSSALAKSLAASEQIQNAFLSMGKAGPFTTGTVSGAAVAWNDNEATVLLKVSGQDEVGVGIGSPIVIVLNDPGYVLATSLCVVNETAQIMDINSPDLDGGYSLSKHALLLDAHFILEDEDLERHKEDSLVYRAREELTTVCNNPKSTEEEIMIAMEVLKQVEFTACLSVEETQQWERKYEKNPQKDIFNTTFMQTPQPGQIAYQAELTRLLKLSTLTPGNYMPSVHAKAGHHAAVLVDELPVILCGSSEDPASVAQAEALANSTIFQNILREAKHAGEIHSGIVAGSLVQWQDTESAIVSKPSGQVEMGHDDGPLIAIVLNDPKHALTTKICVTTTTARILDIDVPELDDGHKLPALFRGDPLLEVAGTRLLMMTGNTMNREQDTKAFEDAANKYLGFALPTDWTGEVRIVGVRKLDEKIVPVDEDDLIEAYQLYARRSDVQPGDDAFTYLVTCPTQEEAEITIEQLALVDAYSQINEHEKAAQLARIEERRVRRDPNSTDENISEAKEARKLAEYVSSLNDDYPIDMTPNAITIERMQLDDSQVQAMKRELPIDEKIYLNVQFKEKEDAKALGAKWDRQQKSWFITPGVDQSLFDKWMSDDTPALAKTEKESKSEAVRYLAVPYGERAAAKAAGALWDKGAKSWYIGQDADTDKLARWLPENMENQQGPAMSPQEEFADALISLGCIVNGDHPIMDGSKHRISIEGDKKGEKSGFYVGHLDGHPAGYVKNNRTGIEIKWKSKGYVLNDEQKAKLQAEAAEKLKVRAAEQTQLHVNKAQQIGRQMADLIPVITATPYMKTKDIDPLPGALTDQQGKTTFIPATDADGKLWTMQYIREDGTKRFAKDSRKEGCFHVVGNGISALAKEPLLIIAEGYATAASITETSGHATIVAFDSGNLVAVAKALHEKYPDKPILIAGDDDKHLELTQNINPGRSKAIEAAKAVKGHYMLPIFAPGDQDLNPKVFTDFNDLAKKSVLGQDRIEAQVNTKIMTVIEKHQVNAKKNMQKMEGEHKRKTAKIS